MGERGQRPKSLSGQGYVTHSVDAGDCLWFKMLPDGAFHIVESPHGSGGITGGAVVSATKWQQLVTAAATGTDDRDVVMHKPDGSVTITAGSQPLDVPARSWSAFARGWAEKFGTEASISPGTIDLGDGGGSGGNAASLALASGGGGGNAPLTL